MSVGDDESDSRDAAAAAAGGGLLSLSLSNQHIQILSGRLLGPRTIKVRNNASFDVSSFNSVGSNQNLEGQLSRYWDRATHHGLLSLLRREGHGADRDVAALISKALPPIFHCWFDRLWELHSEQTRHYHTAVHLWEMFQYYDTVSEYIIESQKTTAAANCSGGEIIVLLSIFFHDVIYDPKSSRNERDSAKLFEEFIDEILKALGPSTDGGEVTAESAAEEGQRGRALIGALNLVKEKVSKYILATQKHEMEKGDKNDDKLALFLDLDMAGKKPLFYL